MLFCFGLMFYLMNFYLLASSPLDKAVSYNFWAMVILYLIRVERFIKYRIGWYLIDFCYVGNFIVWGCLYFFPLNPIAFCIAFYFATTTLGLALVVYGNAYTFHSIDHFTTTFIHHNGMLAVAAIRWHPIME